MTERKMARGWVVLAAVALLARGTAAWAEQKMLFQYSTFSALAQGRFDGEMTLAEMGRHGDFGLGALNGLDGELVLLDGAFYQIRTDGKAYGVPAFAATPFALSTTFTTDYTGPVAGGMTLDALRQSLDEQIINLNHIQAIRIDGNFQTIRVRILPRQEQPYRLLADVVGDQAVFEYQNVAGTLVGFRVPDYLSGPSVPGYSFHFLTQDRKQGGHVLDLVTGLGTLRIDDLSEFRLSLPKTPGFASADLGTGRDTPAEDPRLADIPKPRPKPQRQPQRQPQSRPRIRMKPRPAAGAD